MQTRREIKRKRIIFYYVLAIVLPCLMLGFLAFRGIKNDQALVEREQRRKLIEAGQQIIYDTDTFLTSIEIGFAEIIDSTNIPQKTIFTDSLLNLFIANHQSVSGIFFVSGSGIPMLLNNKMLYVLDGLLNLSDAGGSHSTLHILEKGWLYEFREKNYQKTIEYYQNILPKVTEEQSQGEILNVIARVQKKLKLENKAIETYELIWDNYPQVFIQNKIPLGAVALLEKCLLHIAKEDTISALETAHFLLNQMQKPLWKLEYSFYDNFLSKINEITSLCENSVDEETGNWIQKINIIKDSLLVLEKHTEYLLSYLGNSEIIFDNMEQYRENNKQRHKTRINEKSYLFSMLSGKNNGLWGLIMDPDYILKNTIQHLILEKAKESNFYWELTGENSVPLLKSESIPEDTPPVYTMFPSNLPSWSLTLYPEDSGLFVSLIGPGEGLFFYIFIVIIIILACGLFFTLRIVNNELYFSRMKSYFMSTVSHEFKSPLTSIRQVAEMLVRGRVTSPEKTQKYYTRILQQSERLSHLIDNILDFSKMEEGQKIFRFERANIIPVVKDMVESFQKHTEDQGFNISLTIPESLPYVVFDKAALEQVMHNLIDNACKYSGDSKSIEIKLLLKGNKIVINISDYGIGIRKEDQDKIFSRFYRAGEELSQTIKGSGIGLTIVKQIVEAHQGEITIESSPGKGSIFSVKLPLSQK